MEKNAQNPTRPRSGLIIGKFMPLHKGHMQLIDYAKNRVEKLTVLVCSLSREPIPGEIRLEWVKELYPDVNVLHHTDENPQEPHEHAHFWDIWTKSIRKLCPQSPDVVFTSETYGDKLAECLEAAHIPFDPKRVWLSVSGTQIRNDPYGNWEYLPKCVRAFYAKRVVIIGAECTGKTTLARLLAKHYGTVWLPEYGREYIQNKQSDPEPEDIPNIARRHLANEDALVREADRLIICDTDMIVTSVLSEYYFEKCPEWIKRASYERRYDLYLLTDTDIPWQADPFQREGPHIRGMLHKRFFEELKNRKVPFVLISGPLEKRIKTAAAAIDRLFEDF
ncbi:AAA family ATPase [Thermodesulfobacteriota bacterium]